MLKFANLLFFRLHEFLYSPLDVQHLCSKKLPVDYFTLDQACLLTAEHATWCLVCDPVAKVVNWLERYVEENLVAVHYNVRTLCRSGFELFSSII